MKTNKLKVTLNEIKRMRKLAGINESNHRILSEMSHRFPYDDSFDPWYEGFPDYNKIHKFPKEFIDWLEDGDGEEGESWARDYTAKRKIKSLVDLFAFWVNESE